ncbi:uncharacterized protein FFB20_05007 [Fusarium fujikuroi]|nr:uncharacterized protein Y057_211 [Fusarium fujikuroi]KLP19513.1 uncharacterized protein LW94_4434 [Fusarium fujikuroi]QGI69298.1 hypothetical protein CEK27_013269 [Fusarium fujikuroi]QGI86662.1 hypothetical protein CEK25_013391 [Fusarium fujikuroi]QGJ00187.1 hypothetical protein CEK26_013255 [Fusarium fujikuroi]
MPRRWFSDRLHDAWGRVAGRRGRQRDQESQSSQHYAEIVAAPDESLDRANHLHLRRGASLPDLLARAALGHIPPPLPLDSQSLWDTPAPALSPVQSQSSGAIGFGTFLGECEREASREDQHFIPTAIITTRNTVSIGQGTENQPWMLPGHDFFPESQPLVPSHLRTGLFLNSQLEHRTLEPCDCCSPKFLVGDWRALTLDPLTNTFTRHESLASSSELRSRDHPKSQDKAFAIPINVITIHSDVFALLLEVLVSPNGLIGQEDELNLPLLLSTLSYALDQGMTRETKKLKRTIDRYIPLRMFHHNPHTKSPRLEFEYYEFRSEEVYRAWLVVSQDVRLRDYLSPSEAVTLYVCLVPDWCWSGCIHDYDERFIDDTNTALASIKGDPGSRFEQVFQGFFNRTRLGLHSWTGSDALSGGGQVSVTKTESHEEALQAFGNQPQVQTDSALTLYGVPFQGTRKVQHRNHPPLSGGDLEETLRGFQGGARRVLDALFPGAGRGSNNSQTPGAQDVPITGALESVQGNRHQSVLDALFTGGTGEVADGSVEDGGFNGMPEGSDYDQMRGDQDIPCVVPPVAVSDTSGSSERGIRRVRRETAVFPRVD